MDFSFDHQFDKHVIGIDEVGRGSWAGPVMACASLLNYKIPIDNRLDDSKKLSRKNRNEILKNLTKNNNGWILDGYPRNLSQANSLNEVLIEINQPLEVVFYLDIPEEVLIDRKSVV